LRIYNKLIFSLVAAFSAINIVLAFFGQKDISIYFLAQAMAFFIITLVYSSLNTRARTALNSLSLVIFAGFLVVALIKVMEIVQK
jgi:hypothetical protein